MACVIAPQGVRAADAPVKMVVLGDSLSAGYGLPGADAFPARLAKALEAKGLAVSITNAGVSGDTASGGLGRVDWSVPGGTEAVILELGANDALRGIDPAVTRKALDGILTKLKDRKIAVLLSGMYAPRNLGPDYVRDFDGIFRRWPPVMAPCIIRFFSTASPPTKNSISAMACIRPRPASMSLSRGSCRRSKN